MNLAIKAKDLSKAYGKFHALEHVNLEIPEKSIFGIIGTSGAGKTTLLKLLSTLEEPTSGVLEIFGSPVPYHNPNQLRQFRQKLGFIAQNYQLLQSLTVFENIALPLRIMKAGEDFIQKEVNRLLDLVGLSDKKDLHTAFLSGGQKQRVAIARALVVNPKILLCDEPTAALDPETTHDVLSLLEDIRQKLETTIILVTHEIGVVGSICDYIAIVNSGTVVETGRVSEIFFNPRQACTQKLLNPKKIKLSDFFKEEKASCIRLFQMKFIGESSKSPLMSQLVSRFGIHPNILAGNIDKVGASSLGQLVVSFEKDDPKLEEALSFLKDHDVFIQELL